MGGSLIKLQLEAFARFAFDFPAYFFLLFIY